MLVHTVGGSAARTVRAVHVPEAVQEDALLVREQVPLLAKAHGAPAPEVRDAGLPEEQAVSYTHLTLPTICSV
eukprot:7771913-Alexandrium_andersonii.AAC.1